MYYSTMTLDELLAEKARLVAYAVRIDDEIADLIESQDDPVYDPLLLQEEIDDLYDDLAWVNIDMDDLQEAIGHRG